MLTYFDAVKIPIVAHCIDLLDQGIIKNKSNLQLQNDLLASIIRQYAHYNEHEVFRIEKFGGFFPEVIKDPKKFIFYQPELRKSLTELKEKGVRLFLATNSHIEYMNLIMEQTLGEDWKSLFDLNLANCRKPLFFINQENSFYA